MEKMSEVEKELVEMIAPFVKLVCDYGKKCKATERNEIEISLMPILCDKCLKQVRKIIGGV
jgi:hypothetical protein